MCRCGTTVTLVPPFTAPSMETTHQHVLLCFCILEIFPVCATVPLCASVLWSSGLYFVVCCGVAARVLHPGGIYPLLDPEPKYVQLYLCACVVQSLYLCGFL